MNDFLIGLGVTVAIIAFVEVFKSIDKKLIAAFTLACIPFIYIGFTWGDAGSLGSAVVATAFFFGLAYAGYKRNFNYVIIGLVLHGFWDLVFPHYSEMAPAGYDVFCLTIDWLLALYFPLRIKMPPQ
jgi:hypothetical protein